MALLIETRNGFSLWHYASNSYAITKAEPQADGVYKSLWNKKVDFAVALKIFRRFYPAEGFKYGSLDGLI